MLVDLGPFESEPFNIKLIRIELLSWGTQSPPALPHRMQSSKCPKESLKMADRVWKGVHPRVFGHSIYLLLFKSLARATVSTSLYV